MKYFVQFFKGYKEISTLPLAEKPGSLGVFEVEMNPSYQDAELVDGEVQVVNFWEPVETSSQKFDRVYAALLALDTIDENTDHEILEGLEFSDKQIGDLIVARVFPDEKTGEPNPHGQTALLAKIMADPSYATNPDAIAKSQAINNIRLFFGLSRLTPEEQAERRARWNLQ